MALVALATLAVGCAEDRWDCRDICQTVHDCIIGNLDVSACTDQCVSYSRFDNTTRAQAESCNDCLDATACDLAETCGGVCAFVTLPLD